MARYDRIAPLPTPRREQAFDCWPVLLDCELQPRDAEAGRRARMRFVALRPLARVVRQQEKLDRPSLLRQLTAVNDELGLLGARDPERAVLRSLVGALEGGVVEGIVTSAIAVAEFCLENAAPAAAGEYARWALDLAEQWKCEANMAAATRVMARVQVARGAGADALVTAERACEMATTAADRAEWLRAVAAWAAAHRANKEPQRARDVLLQSLRRARDWRNEALIGLANAHLCEDALEAGEFEAAVDYGWSALRSIDAGAQRGRVLVLTGIALTRLNLWRAADRCFTIAQSATDAAVRAFAAGGSALCAAHDHDLARFTDRRAAALRDLMQLPAYRRAETHIALGRAAALSGQVDAAREHLREAITLVGMAGPAVLRDRAEEILSLLERRAEAELERPVQGANEQVRRIAAELERGAETGPAAR